MNVHKAIGSITLLMIVGIVLITILEYTGNTEKIKDSSGNNYRILCIDGVEYLDGTYAFAPHMKPDGGVYTCEK